jgi:hypothetical protein
MTIADRKMRKAISEIHKGLDISLHLETGYSFRVYL